MIQELARLIPTHSEIFVEATSVDTFHKLPTVLECEKPIYCTTSLPVLLRRSTEKTVYLRTSDLLQVILESFDSLPFSLVIMHTCETYDPSWFLIVDLLEYYRKTKKTLSPKTIFVGISPDRKANIMLKQAETLIQFDDLSDNRNKRYDRIKALVKQCKGTIGIIVPTNNHVQMISQQIGKCRKLLDDTVGSFHRITVCTVNSCQWLSPVDVVIDMMLAPVKTVGMIRVTNHNRLITKRESNAHRLLAKQLYIPMCSSKVYESLPETTVISPCPYVLEKQALLLKSHDLPLDIIQANLSMLHDYRLISRSLTQSGKFCLESPLDVRKSLIIYFMHIRRSPYLFLHLAVLCTVDVYDSNLFRWPKRTENETVDFLTLHERVTYYETTFGGYSDITTLYNIWLALIQRGDPLDTGNLKSFCNEHTLSFYTLKRALNLAKECMDLIDVSIPSSADTNALANELFRYLEVLMPETKATVSYRGCKPVLLNANDTYEINDKSVRKMHICNNQQYYILASKEMINKGMTLKCATLIHAMEGDDDVDSVFSE